MGISAGSLSDYLQTENTACFLLLLKKHSPKVSSRPSKEKATRFAIISLLLLRLGLEKGKQLENDLFIYCEFTELLTHVESSVNKHRSTSYLSLIRLS